MKKISDIIFIVTLIVFGISLIKAAFFTRDWFVISFSFVWWFSFVALFCGWLHDR